MPRASALTEPLANSSQVFDHRESVSTRRRISIETGDCANQCKSCLARRRGACAAGCCGKCLGDWAACRGCVTSTRGLCVIGCVATAITLLVLWLQHDLAPREPTRPRSRCSAGVAETYKVRSGETCSWISRMHGVPQFDIVDQSTTRSCCESATIQADDILEFCRSPPPARWLARGLPHEKLVMTYIGGVGSLLPPTRYGCVGC